MKGYTDHFQRSNESACGYAGTLKAGDSDRVNYGGPRAYREGLGSALEATSPTDAADPTGGDS